MKKYIFDRNKFKWAEEFYNLIQKEMELPDWFGKNADALWDMLTGYVDTPCEIALKNFTGKENDQLKCHEDNEHYVIDNRDSKYIKE